MMKTTYPGPSATDSGATGFAFGTPYCLDDKIAKTLELPVFTVLVDQVQELAVAWGAPLDAVVAVALYAYLGSRPDKVTAERHWHAVMDEVLWPTGNDRGCGGQP